MEKYSYRRINIIRNKSKPKKKSNYEYCNLSLQYRLKLIDGMIHNKSLLF